MLKVQDVTAEQIEQFLAAARQTMAEVRHCWLASRAQDGGVNVRAVRVNAGAPGSDEWTRRILVRRGSRKVAEMRLEPLITLAFQHDSGDRYVALGGRAVLVEDLTEMRTLWSGTAGESFPSEWADANMIVLRVDVDWIEVHARGVTREPFGHGRTLLRRETSDTWRYVPY